MSDMEIYRQRQAGLMNGKLVCCCGGNIHRMCGSSAADFFLWFAIVALIVRPFGVRLPLGLFSFRERSSAFQSLTFPQYVMVCGVLSFGCGMFILTTASSYIEWKYFHGSSRFLSGDELFKNALTWPILAGVMFGVISFFSGSRTSLK